MKAPMLDRTASRTRRPLFVALLLFALLVCGRLYAEGRAETESATQEGQRPRQSAVPAVGTVQQKYALVIGNGAYTGITQLNNPENDANDISATLRDLGFTVETVINGSLDQMESAALRLRERLGATQNSYGFFFYAGHAVQSGGENYLIPVDANIQSENFLRQRAVSMQTVLGELNDAGNVLGVTGRLPGQPL